MVFTIVIILVGLCAIGFSIYMMGYDKGSKKEIYGIYVGLCMIGVIAVIAGMVGLFNESCKFEARQRLNEPVVSEAQLYGYEIVDKSYFIEKHSVDTSEKSKHLIKIKNVLPTIKVLPEFTFEDVEVSEKIYEDAYKGKVYMPYMPTNDPNAPTPAMQDQ